MGSRRASQDHRPTAEAVPEFLNAKILNAKSSITSDTALSLSVTLGTSAELCSTYRGTTCTSSTARLPTRCARASGSNRSS